MKLKINIGGYWFDRGSLVEEVKEIIEKIKPYESLVKVELYGVDLYAKSLPQNYEIVSYGSLETIAVCDDGQLITDAEGIAKWVDKLCSAVSADAEEEAED